MTDIELLADEPGRADVFLSTHTELTRSRIEKLIREGRLNVDGTVVEKAGYALRGGERLRLRVPEPAPTELVAQDIPLSVVYEDGDLAVVYKPSGMVVHPAAGNPDGTMANALLCALDGLSAVGGKMRPGIVHRIDKDTSGLLLVAKNDRSHLSLAEQIARHSIDRAYLAIAYGHFKQDSGEIDAPIGRHPTNRKKMAIVPDGRPAMTRYRVLEAYRDAALVEATLFTGRTHQIRVHLTSIGHPLLGDPVYGPAKPKYAVPGGQLLHAFRIGFLHPSTGEPMHFEAPPEPRFEEWRAKLARER